MNAIHTSVQEQVELYEADPAADLTVEEEEFDARKSAAVSIEREIRRLTVCAWLGDLKVLFGTAWRVLPRNGYELVWFQRDGDRPAMRTRGASTRSRLLCLGGQDGAAHLTTDPRSRGDRPSAAPSPASAHSRGRLCNPGGAPLEEGRTRSTGGVPGRRRGGWRTQSHNRPGNGEAGAHLERQSEMTARPCWKIRATRRRFLQSLIVGGGVVETGAGPILAPHLMRLMRLMRLLP